MATFLAALRLAVVLASGGAAATSDVVALQPPTVVGTWENLPCPSPGLRDECVLEITLEGSKATGTLTSTTGEAWHFKGKWSESTLTFSVTAQTQRSATDYRYSAASKSDDSLSGTIVTMYVHGRSFWPSTAADIRRPPTAGTLDKVISTPVKWTATRVHAGGGQ